MNPLTRQQLRIGYILLTVAFISPFVVMLVADKMFGINLPWWTTTLLIMGGAWLFFEVFDRYERMQMADASRRSVSRRDIVLFIVVYVGGFGLLQFAHSSEAQDSGFSSVLTLIGLALIGVGLFLRLQVGRKASG